MDAVAVDTARGVARLVRECAGVLPGERVLVVTDTRSYRYGLAVMAAAAEVAREVSMMMMPTYGRIHGQQPPRAVAEAMKCVDVVFLPTEWSLSHSAARRDASRAGVRCLTIPHPDDELFARTMVQTPFRELKEAVVLVNGLLSAADEARVTTPAGTDLVLSLKGRVSVDLEHGYCRPEPDYARNFAAPPCVEANIAPVEDSAEGIVVVDACQSAIGLVQQPIVLEVRRGWITAIRGGHEADALQFLLQQAGERELLRVAELGIGLNPVARVRGRFIEDESVYGTAHIGMGNNESTMDGKICANGHCDNIFWKPTVELDGKMVMRDGVLRVDGIPPVLAGRA